MMISSCFVNVLMLLLLSFVLTSDDGGKKRESVGQVLQKQAKGNEWWEEIPELTPIVAATAGLTQKKGRLLMCSNQNLASSLKATIAAPNLEEVKRVSRSSVWLWGSCCVETMGGCSIICHESSRIRRCVCG